MVMELDPNLRGLMIDDLTLGRRPMDIWDLSNVVPAEKFGMRPGGDSSKNTTAFQRALLETGVVSLARPGVFDVADTSAIYSGTLLRVAPGSAIRMATGTNKKILINYAAAQAIAGVRATVTVAYTSGVIATVTHTSHGLTERDSVVLQGATQWEYWDIFRVHKVVDANTYQIRLRKPPAAAASGTIYAYACDSGIGLDLPVGAYFDYNWNSVLGSSSTTDIATNRHAVVLGYVNRLRINGFEARNADKFALNVFAASDYDIRGIRGTNAAEILKQYGPLAVGHVTGLSGQTFDDSATIQALEGTSFLNYMPSRGNIHDLTLEDCAANTTTANGSMCFGIYGDDTYEIDGIKFKNIEAYSENGSGIKFQWGTGYGAVAAWSSVTAYVSGDKVRLNGLNYVCIQGHTNQTPPNLTYWYPLSGKMGNVRLEGFNGAGKAGTNFGIHIVSEIDTLEVINPQAQWEDVAGTNLFRQESTSTIRCLTFSGYRHTGTENPNTATAYVANINGNVDTVTFNACALQMNSTFGRFLSVGANTIRCMTFNGMTVNSAALFGIFQAGGIVTRVVTMQDCQTTSCATIWDARSPVNLTLIGGRFNNASSGILRPNTANVICKIFGGEGTVFDGTTVAIAPQSPAGGEVYGDSIPADITTLLRTVGQHCYNSNAAANNGTDGAVGVGVFDCYGVDPALSISTFTNVTTTGTVTTTASHGLSTGDKVSIQFALDSASATAWSNFNVVNASITVTGATTFTLTLPGTPAGTYTAGTGKLIVHKGVWRRRGTTGGAGNQY